MAIMNCTGIPEKSANRIFLYPNPVVDELMLKCKAEESGKYHLVIFNESGREVVSKVVIPGNGEINSTLSTKELPSGAYSVKLVSPSGKLFEGKFLKM